MDKINYSEVLFQSIDQIVEERLKQVQYDRTIACEILEAHPEENLYWVNCEGLKIQVSSIDPKKTYSKNTLVYVLVPNGNYENTKVIIGGYSAKDIEKKTYNNSYDNFIPNKTFYVINENNPIVLSVKNLNVQETDAISYSPIQYNREYDYVGVHWSMQTYQLFDANITSGQYTLEIVFGNKTDDAIVSYPIHSSSIYGNPYSLSEEFEQYTLFPYSDKLNTCTHFKIRLYQGVKDETNPENRIDQFNYTGVDNPQIILCSLDLSVGYTNTDFKEEQSLNIGKHESLNYKLNDKSNSLKRTLYFDWRIIDKNKDNQIFNYNISNFGDFINNAHIYWLQYQENEGYQSFEKLQNINFDYANIEGLYNWKIINNNNFNLLVDIDTDYQTDQYKIFIVYDHWITITDEQGNEIQTQYSDYAFTNTIIFENLDIAPIQLGAATADKPNSLNLKLNKGNTGIYNVYGLDGQMVESSKQGPYYITASLYDSLYDKIYKVEWIFPSSNTMIIDARDDGWGKLSNNEKLTAKYRIKTQYYSSATFNIIQCKITMTTGEIRNASISLQFGEVGNQGTNYAFNIDFIDKDYLTYGQGEEIQIKATLSNQNGEEVLLEDFIDKLEWSWLFVENPGVITNKADSVTNITSISNIVCSKHKNNIVKLRLHNNFDFSQANYSILQAKLKEYNTGDNIKTDLLTYLCVPVAAADTATIKPRSMQGAARVVYDSLGTATTYSKEAYEIINADGTQVTDLTWELSVNNDYSGLPTLTESNIKVNANITDADAVYITKYKIKPSSYVPPEIPPVAIIAKQGNIIYWSQPILIIQNTWFNETINEWNGVLKINEKDGSILSPLLIAGTKGSNNLFTGVTVGQLDTGSTTTNRTVNGIYGFKEGKARFWLNQDAEFFIGNGENKNIYFDANGNFSIVAKSFDFRTPDEIPNKLILSSTNQEFQIGNENSYLKFYTPEGESQKKFEIKANDFEFNSTNYNGFSMRVGKEGFYVGAEDEYISFEKEDGGFSRTLKISANNFDFKTTDNTLRLSSKTGEFYISDGKNYLQFQKEQKEYKEGETVTRSSVFKIKANEFEFNNDGYDSFDLRVSKTGFYVGTENEYISLEKELKEDGSQDYYRTLKISASNFEFNSTNYNGFSMRVGKEGFYVGTKNEYISFEKEIKNDGTTNYYRTLKIKAKDFDFTSDTIGLSITNQRLTIGHIPTEGEENSNYISLDPYGNLTMNLDNFNLETDHLKLSSNNGGEFKVGNNNYYLKFGGSYSTGLDIKTKNFILDTPTLKIDTTAISNNGFVLEVSGRGTIAGMQLSNGAISNVVGWNENNNLYSGYSCGLSSAFDYSKGRDIFLWVGAHRNSAVYRPANEWTDLWLDEISNNNWNVDSPHWGFSVKENIKDTASFYVTWDGVLHAKNANITGTITATSGSVGGYTIDQNRLYCSGAGINNNGYGTAFWAGEDTGDHTGNSAAFHVYHDGSLYATKANIEGTVTATFGSVGGWQIEGGRIYNTNPTTGYTFSLWNPAVAGGNIISCDNGSDYPFYVTRDGFLHANNAEIRGTITAGSLLGSGFKVVNNGGAANGPGLEIGSRSAGQSWVSLEKEYLNAGYRGDTSESARWYAVVFAANEWDNGSDKRLKNSIADFDESYETFFNFLHPVTFKYNQGKSGRRHSGFIAQEVVSALEKANLSTMDFAGPCLLNYGTDHEGYWWLRRDQFVALNTWQIQKLKTRVTELENEIKEIKQRYEI